MHEPIVRDFIRHVRPWLHALEFNTMQTVKANRRVAAIAEEFDLPVVSGGDRHGFEPNAVLNLTNARTFSEFVHEIRHEKKSIVLFMAHYRRPITVRYAENVNAMIKQYPDMPGREAWYDRVFYRCPDGVTRSFTEMMGDHRAVKISRVVIKILGMVAQTASLVAPLFNHSSQIF